MLAKSVLRGAGRAVVRSMKAAPMGCASVGAQRSMVTLDEKERGEEAKYFAAKDRDTKAEMKAAMEKILDEGDDSEAKEELMAVLGKYLEPLDIPHGLAWDAVAGASVALQCTYMS